MLFDSHAHINHDGYNEGQKKRVIEEIYEDKNLKYVMDVGFDLESSQLAVKHAGEHDWCFAAVGVHPHNGKEVDDMQLMMLKGLAKKEKVKAIGEIGLDFHYRHSSKEEQRKAFREQIKLANELKMPIIIHSREADQEVLDVLKEEGAFSSERKSWFPKRSTPEGWTGTDEDARVLLHCYSGGAELAEQYVRLGATISIAGPVTYKNNKKTVKVVESLPIDFLMIETDSPFLTPEPLRGKQNKPSNVKHTARRISVIKQMNYEEVVKRTYENAKVFFDI